ncbi:restriction endonuclease subunit S [Bradyrhizobium sp. USDA 4454]
MTVDTPPHLVPKLRFAEFVDDPPWECTALMKLANRVTQRSTRGAELRALTNSAEYGIVDQREYFDKDIATNTDNYYIVETGDYVYNPRTSSAAPVGPISKNRLGTGVMSPLYTVFRFRNDANDFFAHYFKSSHWHGYLRLVSNSGARHDRMAITSDDLMRMPIPTPASQEQQKIADCLSSLDDLIAAEDRKLETLQQHKQGLMQQLFPLPGETVPRLRFPEFKDSPVWKEERLGDMVTIVSGKSPSQYTLFSQGNCAFVKVEDLNNCTKYQVYGREYCDDVRDAVPGGSILFPKRGAAIENNKIRVTAAEMLIDTNLMALTPHDTAATEFLYYYIVRVGLAQIADTSSIPQINNKHIIPYRVLIPSETSEQQRIGDCLSVVDAGLAAQVQKLSVLKEHKDGLMQQLFPSLDGVEQ